MRKFHPIRQPINAQLSTRKVKCPHCHHVFEQADVLTRQPKLVCKSCLKVFYTDTRDPHSTLIGTRDPRSI